MYAIVTTGGKQYKVAVDDYITVEKLDGEVGSTVELPVLFLNDGKQIVSDAASLEGVTATAEIVKQFKGEKKVAFHFHRRTRYHKKVGHRQLLTELKITAIKTGAAEPEVQASAE